MGCKLSCGYQAYSDPSTYCLQVKTDIVLQGAVILPQ